MKSIVTGGRGFIGSELVKRLLMEHNDDVIVIDNSSSNSKNNFEIEGAQYIDDDLKDFDKMLPVFKNADRVFHLAADVSIDYCNKYPRQSGINNSNTTLNLLECCKINNIKKFIFSSTSAVYKEKETIKKYKESDEVYPQNTYSASKLFGENLCKIYYELYGINTICLRYFNVYGSNLSISPYSSVIVKLLEAKKNNATFSINGDGSQERDFVHVEDICNANIMASIIDLSSYGEIFNVGCGESTSIKQIVEASSINSVNLPTRMGDIKYSCADVSKLENTFKWKPENKIKNWLKNNLK
jgi:UDP-glucose 4-epimerase